MNKEEIKIITLGDIFRNLETEEQAFEFLKYIKNLQQENEKLKDNWDKLRKWLKEYEEGTYGLGSYETGLSDGLGDVIKKMQELQGSDSNE